METKLTLKQMALIASLMISGNLVQAMGHPFIVPVNQSSSNEVETRVTPIKANRFVAVTAGIGSIAAAGTPAAVAVITDGGKAVTNVVASKAVTNAVAPRSFGLFKNPFMATSTNKVVVPEAFGLFKNPFVKSVDNIVVAPVATSSNAVSTFANIVNKGCELGQATLGAVKNAGNAGFAIVKNHPKTMLAVAVGTVALGYAYKYYKYNKTAKSMQLWLDKIGDILEGTRAECLRSLKSDLEECYASDVKLLNNREALTDKAVSAFEGIKISKYLGTNDSLAQNVDVVKRGMCAWFNTAVKDVTQVSSVDVGSWQQLLLNLDVAIKAEEAKAAKTVIA